MKPSKMYKALPTVAFSILVIVLATRLTTLEFGRIFPVQTAQDRQAQERITALTAEVQEMREEISTLKERLAGVEENLTQPVEPPTATEEPQAEVAVVEPEPATQATESTEPEEPAEESASSDADDSSEVVHKDDSMEKVRRVFGRPESVNDYDSFVVWRYGLSKSVTFEDGKVKSWDDMPIEP